MPFVGTIKKHDTSLIYPQLLEYQRCVVPISVEEHQSALNKSLMPPIEPKRLVAS